MKKRLFVVMVISLTIGIGIGLLLARHTFASPSKIRDPKQDWLMMAVSNKETAVLRSYIVLLEQDRWARQQIASIASLTDQQKAERIQAIWDNNVRMVDLQLKQLRKSEQKYSEAYPDQYRPNQIFSHIRTVLDTGKTVSDQPSNTADSATPHG